MATEPRGGGLETLVARPLRKELFLRLPLIRPDYLHETEKNINSKEEEKDIYIIYLSFNHRYRIYSLENVFGMIKFD